MISIGRYRNILEFGRGTRHVPNKGENSINLLPNELCKPHKVVLVLCDGLKLENVLFQIAGRKTTLWTIIRKAVSLKTDVLKGSASLKVGAYPVSRLSCSERLAHNTRAGWQAIRSPVKVLEDNNDSNNPPCRRR